MPADYEPRRPEAAARLALAVARGESIKAAAAALDVPYTTARRWSKSERFKAAVEKHRKAMTDRVLGQLTAAGTKAVAAIVTLMDKAENEGVKLAAAKAILDKLPDLAEYAELRERLESLELLASTNKGGRHANWN